MQIRYITVRRLHDMLSHAGKPVSNLEHVLITKYKVYIHTFTLKACLHILSLTKGDKAFYGSPISIKTKIKTDLEILRTNQDRVFLEFSKNWNSTVPYSL